MIVEGNDRYAELICVSATAEMVNKKLSKALDVVQEQLKRIESKRTLGIKLNREERAIWLLYGTKTQKK